MKNLLVASSMLLVLKSIFGNLFTRAEEKDKQSDAFVSKGNCLSAVQCSSHFSQSLCLYVYVSCADIQYGYCASFGFLSDAATAATDNAALIIIVDVCMPLFVELLLQLNVTRLPLSWTKYTHCVSTLAYHYLAVLLQFSFDRQTSLFVYIVSKLIKNPDK